MNRLNDLARKLVRLINIALVIGIIVMLVFFSLTVYNDVNTRCHINAEEVTVNKAFTNATVSGGWKSSTSINTTYYVTFTNGETYALDNPYLFGQFVDGEQYTVNFEYCTSPFASSKQVDSVIVSK